jgi:hypothetical protein
MVTEPAIRAIRRRLPANLSYFPLDIAFLVLFALALFAEYGIVPLMLDYAAELRRSALSVPSVPALGSSRHALRAREGRVGGAVRAEVRLLAGARG